MAENTNGLNEVAEYLKRVRLKSAVVGGVDREDAYQAMSRLTQIFSKVYNELANENNALRQQNADLKKALDAEKKRAEKPASAEETAPAENAAPAIELPENSSEAVLEVAEKAQKEITRLRTELSEAVRRGASAEEALDAEKVKSEKLIADLNAASAELKTIKEADREREFEKETLEEIYIDAKRKRNNMIAEAQEEAERIRSGAEEDLKELRKKVEEAKEAFEAEKATRYLELDRELDEKRAAGLALESETQKNCDERIQQAENQASKLIDDARNDAAELRKNAEEAAEKVREDAEKDADELRVEARKVLDSAKKRYIIERARFDEQINKLGDVRTSIIRDLNGNIASLQKFVNDITERGAEIEAKAAPTVETAEDNK